VVLLVLLRVRNKKTNKQTNKEKEPEESWGKKVRAACALIVYREGLDGGTENFSYQLNFCPRLSYQLKKFQLFS